MLKSLLAYALLIAVASCQNNIDTTVPILRSVAGVREFDYFSYSIALHQRQANPSSRDAALSNTRIIVSAPMYNINGASVENTGAVWSCPVNSGACSPITGDNGGADNRLFDMEGNSSENKTNQFLGSSMVSNGDYFMVCAHRHKVLVGSSYFPRGMCYYSDRDLSGFSAFSPCSRFGSTRNAGSGVCNAGTSSVVTSTGSTNEAYAVGAPGSFLWRGAVARLLTSSNTLVNTPSTQDPFGLFGYAMVAGRFSSTSRLDYAVSNPRFSQATYLGRVSIVMNSNALSITNQPLNGQQMGEYYGFSLLAANLAGDSFDELIVGAPMYRSGTQPDTGRIFVYANNNGALSLVRTIVGRDTLARFGHAMANLGDINGDGFDDIAVSAPFGSGSGSVYIYYSSATNTITPTPAQVITGELVRSNLSPISTIRGFGTSLASGVDVDGNTYNDLAVGTILSQQVYLLRTRPLAQVAVGFTASTLIVNLDDMTCMLGGTSYACFDLTVCLTYTGSGLDSNVDLTVTLLAERQNLQNNLEQRIFFGPTPGQFPSTYTEVVSAALSTESCFNTTAYVQNGITDRFNGFILEAMITPPVLDPPSTDGNAAPMDFSGFPVVSTSGTTMIQVETFKDCAGNTCVPDLGVAVTDVIFTGMNGVEVPELTVGAVNQVDIRLRITNSADDAFQSTVSLRYSTTQLRLQRIFNNTVTGQLTLTCSENTQDGFTTHTCNIGNPFNSNGEITVDALFSPRPELVGDEGTVDVLFTVGSVNEEAAGTGANNMLTQQLTTNARADVFLDVPGIVFPVSVSYSNVLPQINRSVTDLGPSIRTTFVVRNSGPSPVPTIGLTVMWPIDGPETGINDFLYPASISAVSTATVMCSNTNINSNSLELPEEDETDGEGGSGVPSGKRRRRRSVPKMGRKVKRQTEVNIDESEDTTVTLDRTLSCMDNAPSLNCVPITCTILGLQGGSSAQVEILSYLDERYFHMRNDRFTFVPTASVSIENADYIISGQAQSTTSSANIVAIPASSINPETIVPPFPWYAVVFPIIAVIIIIVVIVIILYFGGFFRRAKHEEIKQKREELQNLAENGVSAGGDDGTNL